MTPTQKQFDRLPQWAKSYISRLKTELRNSEAKLTQHLDAQTPSKIWFGYDSLDSPKRFVQTDHIELEHNGVHLDVNLHHEDSIKLSWRCAGSRGILGDISLIPESYQQARISNPVYNEHSLRRLLQAKERDQRERETS
jgi:sulfur relay (sulfurtransferase) complex TusBCD TusD component (DsrE family)